LPRTVWQALLFLFGFWAIIALIQPLAARGAELSDPQLLELERALHAAVNQFRAEEHLIPLERRSDLDAVARAHCADMIARGYFSHDTPDGLNPVQRMQRAGLDGFTLAAENVGQTTERDPNRAILEGWKRSPAHRRNLEARPFNTTGLGIVRASNGTLYYTQLYATFPR
jgi:uncharacterized protein YkwD